jgi:hypothetical protein
MHAVNGCLSLHLAKMHALDVFVAHFPANERLPNLAHEAHYVHHAKPDTIFGVQALPCCKVAGVLSLGGPELGFRGVRCGAFALAIEAGELDLAKDVTLGGAARRLCPCAKPRPALMVSQPRAVVISLAAPATRPRTQA